MSRNQNKQLVDIAVAAGLRARQRGSQTILPTNQRRDQLGQRVLAGQATGRNSSYVVLADNFGTLTEAGRQYYTATGETRPDGTGIDRNQALIHRNGSDYIRLRNGQEKVVGTLQPTGETTLTALGRRFFKDKYTEYVVNVPVLVSGTRAGGVAYLRPSTLPVN